MRRPQSAKRSKNYSPRQPSIAKRHGFGRHMICDQDLDKLLEDYELNEHIVDSIEQWLERGLGLKHQKTGVSQGCPSNASLWESQKASRASSRRDSFTDQTSTCISSRSKSNIADETMSSIPISWSETSVSPVQRRTSRSNSNIADETMSSIPISWSEMSADSPVQRRFRTMSPVSKQWRRGFARSIGSASRRSSSSDFKPFRETSGLDPKRESHYEPGPVHFYRPTCVGWSPYPHKFTDATIGSVYPLRDVASSVRSLSRSSGRSTPQTGFRKTMGLDPKRDSEFEPGPTQFFRESCMGWSLYPHKYSDSTIGVMFRPLHRRLIDP